jgi:hypothetical protein
MHHQREWRYGTTDLIERVPIRQPWPERFAARVPAVPTERGCLEWTGHRNKAGYGQFWLDGHNMTASRVAYEMNHGDIPEGMVVRHKCDNPPCVNPDHLEIGTPADNSRDKVERGRSLKGDVNPSASLTWCDVYAIREMYEEGWTGRRLAAEFGTSQSNVSRIVKHLTWQVPA